jgi:hypothetical protein
MSECSLWLKSDANTTAVLLTGLPFGATDDDVREAVAGAAGGEELVTGIVVARPCSAGPCLGQALAKLADEDVVQRVCQAEFQVRCGGGPGASNHLARAALTPAPTGPPAAPGRAPTIAPKLLAASGRAGGPGVVPDRSLFAHAGRDR